MLHHSRHGASRFSRSLHETQAFPPGALRSAARLTSIWRRDFASSPPHASLLPRTNANSTRWLQANGRRVLGARLGERPRVVPALISSVQWRTLSAGGKGGGDGKEEGLFDRLKKTFQEEIDKVCTINTINTIIAAHYYCCYRAQDRQQYRVVLIVLIDVLQQWFIVRQRINTRVGLVNEIIDQHVAMLFATGCRGRRSTVDCCWHSRLSIVHLMSILPSNPGMLQQVCMRHNQVVAAQQRVVRHLATTLESVIKDNVRITLYSTRKRVHSTVQRSSRNLSASCQQQSNTCDPLGQRHHNSSIIILILLYQK